MQDLLPTSTQKSNSLYGASMGAGGGSSSNYSTSARNTLNSMFQSKLSTASQKLQQLQHQHSYQSQLTPPPPPPPAPTSATATTHCPPPIPPLPPLLGNASSNEKYYATTAICKANAATNATHGMGGGAVGGVGTNAGACNTLPNGSIGGGSGSLASTTASLASSSTTPTGGGYGYASSAGTLAAVKPHHYNLDMSGNGLAGLASVDVNEELANFQVQEFPRQSLVIVEKLGCGVFGELHLCETKSMR